MLRLAATCMHDPMGPQLPELGTLWNCGLFWSSCIPLPIIDFAVWCYPHYLDGIPPIYDTQNAGVNCVYPGHHPNLTRAATPAT